MFGQHASARVRRRDWVKPIERHACCRSRLRCVKAVLRITTGTAAQRRIEMKRLA